MRPLVDDVDRCVRHERLVVGVAERTLTVSLRNGERSGPILTVTAAYPLRWSCRKCPGAGGSPVSPTSPPSRRVPRSNGRCSASANSSGPIRRAWPMPGERRSAWWRSSEPALGSSPRTQVPGSGELARALRSGSSRRFLPRIASCDRTGREVLIPLPPLRDAVAANHPRVLAELGVLRDEFWAWSDGACNRQRRFRRDQAAASG